MQVSADHLLAQARERFAVQDYYGAVHLLEELLASFLESLRLDLNGTAVKVTVIHPGFVKSEMTAKNLFPMPFLMETDAAVDRMGEGLLRGDAEIAFPWQLASAARFARMLPSSVLSLAAGALKPAGEKWTASPLHRGPGTGPDRPAPSSGGTNQ